MSKVAVCGFPAFVNCCARGSSLISASMPDLLEVVLDQLRLERSVPVLAAQSTALPSRGLPLASFFACASELGVTRTG